MKVKKAVSLMLAVVLSAVVFTVKGVYANLEAAPVESLRGSTDIADGNVLPKIKPVPKNQERIALDYVNQPPLIPHATDGYQVNQSNNGCLKCHDVNVYRKTGAPRVSPTHYQDRDGKLLTEVAPRRYFCLQCHVPQAQAEPLVENEFVPAGKFGE